MREIEEEQKEEWEGRDRLREEQRRYGTGV